eukprot:sb/3477570/
MQLVWACTPRMFLSAWFPETRHRLALAYHCLKLSLSLSLSLSLFLSLSLSLSPSLPLSLSLSLSLFLSFSPTLSDLPSACPRNTKPQRVILESCNLYLKEFVTEITS